MLFSMLPIAQIAQAQPSIFMQFVPLIAIAAIFYFLMIAPMRKRQKALQQLVAALKKGDKVVTTGGIYGEVHSVQEQVVLLKLADNIRIRVAKSAIAGLEGSEELGVGT